MLTPGTHLGSYEVIAPLGAGGMGEVYRARDTKLGRQIAIKILPEGFTHDRERLARFQREAQLLAALNHPHIAAIHGLDESEGSPFLVMELVEGGTLADRLKAGPLLMAEALAIARQIADALEAAHEKGIVHRDLKPANIAMTSDGQVKVLDFGLARTVEVEAASGLTHSPTLTIAATQAGVVLGTAGYMSPEQAKGKAADKRTDVWAFGCVLFEMLTGKRAFDGEDVTDIIAAVVRGEPDYAALPAGLSEPIRLLIKRCLEKDRRARVADLSTARFLMTETITVAPNAPPSASVAVARSNRPVVIAVVALLTGILLTAIGAWIIARSQPQAPRDVVRFTVSSPLSMPIARQTTDRDIAVSPDGRRIVYLAGPIATQAQLMIRSLNELEPRPLTTVLGARYPFISPDGLWVGFFAADALKRVSIAGGPPITICPTVGVPRGASWGSDNTIVFATSDPSTGLLRVPAAGGQPTPLSNIDLSKGEVDHFLPSWMPDGHRILFTIASQGGLDSGQIAVLDVRTGQSSILIRGATHAEFVEPGFLAYAVDGTLRVVRFDAERLSVAGDVVPIVDQLSQSAVGAASFAVSQNGSLVFIPGVMASTLVARRSLVWVDRQGREQPVSSPPRAYAVARLSPDGGRVALDIRDLNNDIWIWDFARQTLTPLTFDADVEMSPVWTADGLRVIWSTVVTGLPKLFWRAADGTGQVEQLAGGPLSQFPTSTSSDGTRLFLFENAAGGQDIATLDLPVVARQNSQPSPAVGLSRPAESGTTQKGLPEPRPLIRTPAAELNAEISPDGHWVAYQSSKSRQFEIYVSPYPNVDGGLWQISTAGGTRPVWSRDGRELFYLDANGLLTVAPIGLTPGGGFNHGSPTRLVNTAYYNGFTTRGIDLRGYDVSPDGKRFLMIKESATEAQKTGEAAVINVVLNWAEELKSKLPAR